MRALATLLVFLGSACALAQDPAPVNGLPRPGIQLVSFTFVQAAPPAAGSFAFSGWNVKRVELAGRPSSACSVKLAEMPIPADVHFTMKMVRPPTIDDRIFAEVPAPACP